MIDSHCHLDFHAFDVDRSRVVDRARRAGVSGVLVPGVDEAQWRRSRELRVDDLEIWRAVGVHPSAAQRGDVELLEPYVDELDAVAIGELGWDRRLAVEWSRQDVVADLQIELARGQGLPIILHVVGAHAHALERLTRHGPFGAGGVVHAFSGSAELVERYVALNLCVSVGPSVTRAGARRPLQVARAIPRDRLLLETDGPDQGLPGRARGEPADVLRVAEVVAEARGEAVSTIVASADANARRLFGGE